MLVHHDENLFIASNYFLDFFKAYEQKDLSDDLYLPEVSK